VVTDFWRPVEFNVRVSSLPDRGSRARAERVDVFHDGSSEDDGWVFDTWRMRAFEVTGGGQLEGWFSDPDAPEPLIGRIRIKRCPSGVDADLDDLAALTPHAQGNVGLTEILNLELEPAFLGQRLGDLLVRVALADVPSDDIIACQPRATEFSNVQLRESKSKVDAFYRRLGFVPDGRLPGYLTARRVDLLL
jgi:GNAT superfamily N-acetyltransferase